MVQKISRRARATRTDCSLMSWGYNPYHLREGSLPRGLSRRGRSRGASWSPPARRTEDVYLTFQEYFERLRREPARWGKPLAALLGALRCADGAAASAPIGGKDSMSGTLLSRWTFRRRWCPLPSRRSRRGAYRTPTSSRRAGHTAGLLAPALRRGRSARDRTSLSRV